MEKGQTGKETGKQSKGNNAKRNSQTPEKQHSLWSYVELDLEFWLHSLAGVLCLFMCIFGTVDTIVKLSRGRGL